MLAATILSFSITVLQFGLLWHLAKRNRTVTACLSLLGMHTVIALATSAAGIFTYFVILGLHSAATVGLLAWIATRAQGVPRSWLREAISKIPLNPLSPLILGEMSILRLALGWSKLIARIEWHLVALLVMTPLFLAMPHFQYRGYISHATTTVKSTVTGYVYPYPYFSDEWYSVALAKQAIADHGWPQSNPLLPDRPPLRDLEAPFHSLLAELLVFLQLDPLRHFTWLSIGINTIIVSLIYAIGRALGALREAALLAAMSALFITNGANLPGLWNLLPVSVGILGLLLSFVFVISNQRWLFVIATVLALLYYPPLIVISAPILLVQSIRNRSWLMTAAAGVLAILLTGITVLAVSLRGSAIEIQPIVTELVGRLWYQSFTPEALPQYAISNIVPLITMLAAGIGLLQIRWRDRWLLTSIGIGIGYWLLYSGHTWRLIIDYQRIIVVTSLLLTILASLGWHTLLIWVITAAKKWQVPRPGLAISLVIVGLTLVLLPNYTTATNWRRLTLYNPTTDQHLLPAAPANDYLQPADVALFAPLPGINLLAPPWKNTVLSVATGIHPLTTKGGTITINPDLFGQFLAANCEERLKLVKNYVVTHVYTAPFTCPGFALVAAGSEDLLLYQVK